MCISTKFLQVYSDPQAAKAPWTFLVPVNHFAIGEACSASVRGVRQKRVHGGVYVYNTAKMCAMDVVLGFSCPV
jgi:hypothetical protein